ncbi:MAG: hypothetical protein JNN27_13265 [Planctomycetes bacterium]|nr:hypothetical protein [Planctomycetota bacterium]
MDNFQSHDDQLVAATLLDNFVFFSDRATNHLLANAYYRLEDELLTGSLSFAGGLHPTTSSLWFTPVEGEQPRPTDSGNALCRKLRNIVGVGDDRFVAWDGALRNAANGDTVVFVDDFVGSGNQLISTWTRKHPQFGESFEDVFNRRAFPAICLALICTATAIERVQTNFPAIHMRCTHVLERERSLTGIGAPILSPPLDEYATQLDRFLRCHTSRLNLPEFLAKSKNPQLGFRELGLLIGFQHHTPDSTLPVLWASGRDGWERLVSHT